MYKTHPLFLCGILEAVEMEVNMEVNMEVEMEVILVISSDLEYTEINSIEICDH